MNKTILIGRLARQPELKYLTTGTPVTQFTLAVSRDYVDKQTGERGADFINCKAWGVMAENLCKFMNKGSQISLIGRTETGTYEDKEGNRRYSTEVVAEKIEFLESKKSKEGQGQSQSSSGTQQESFNQNLSNEPDFNTTIDINGDDLPF